MIYLIFVLSAVVSAGLIYLFSARMGVAKLGNGLLYKPCEEDVTPFQGKFLMLIILISAAVAFVAQISLYKNTELVSFFKLYLLLLIVLAAGIVDAKRRIIPNSLIIIGAAFRVIIYVYEVFTVDNIKSILINDAIGFAIGFVFLALVSFLTKGSLGFGDVKLFGVIGMTAGSFCTYSTLLLALLISAVISVVCIATKKMSRKDSFPFGPCITVGYSIALLLTSY